MTRDPEPAPRHAAAAYFPLAVAVFVVFLVGDRLQELLRLFPFYQQLYHRFAFYVPEGGKSLLQIALCVLAARWVTRATYAQALRELGLGASWRRGIAFGVLASAPMLLGFVATMPFGRHGTILQIAYLALLAPFAEEVLYRAFACGLLYRRAGVPLWLAIAATAVVFGYGHIDKGQSPVQQIQLLVLTGTGGAFFAWFYVRSGFNLWAPFALHVAMNLWWELFEVGKTAIGGWYPFALQAVTMLLALVLVEHAHRRRTAPTTNVAPAGA